MVAAKKAQLLTHRLGWWYHYPRVEPRNPRVEPRDLGLLRDHGCDGRRRDHLGRDEGLCHKAGTSKR
jgi:hypothetical protein